MSIRYRVTVRGGAAIAVAALSALTLAGCGGKGDGSEGDPKASAAQPQPGSSQGSAPSAAADPAQVIATANGEGGMVLAINSAIRESGGFLTVSGQLKNTGNTAFVNTTAWRGNELTASGTSVAGVSLTDKVGKKRYYVLRDTDGRCLCTTGVSTIEAGQTVPFFAQFPAPPASTTEVEFNLPTFASATIKISG
ncbi:hypothetical protein [Streptomyces sp. 2P-4]|uniref:hypothetical protein n=1 Tax=Streptomyces sp. 2P-4 TaxID=2931974 RepID=UPI0025417429|nr:hypothetical protein [Streptomyces sp. 2P-4]